jgi:hypothetical protein
MRALSGKMPALLTTASSPRSGAPRPPPRIHRRPVRVTIARERGLRADRRTERSRCRCDRGPPHRAPRARNAFDARAADPVAAPVTIATRPAISEGLGARASFASRSSSSTESKIRVWAAPATRRWSSAPRRWRAVCAKRCLLTADASPSVRRNAMTTAARPERPSAGPGPGMVRSRRCCVSKYSRYDPRSGRPRDRVVFHHPRRRAIGADHHGPA